ncbi:hypothetical protein IV494_14495 [Kaistella sp. G5-32]|uniref:Lipoprotein n=1 Tax=Kaistella gelatinilytica TaxID=2787636 RepID=A0ABS0FF97_9FLAO|nr:DUF5991 domain-containing protein [Kaistella gelatinilytica]MBF8458390.1 hypothetical protein [Kaistella gelatinilytica]
MKTETINLSLKLLLIFFIISCNGQDKKQSPQKQISTTSEKGIETPDFFNKEYFNGYQLSPTSDFPMYSYVDNTIGEFTINYVNKKIENQKEWLDFDTKNNVISEDEPDDNYFKQLNKLIKNKLEPKLSEYHIIAVFTPSNFINKNKDYKYPYEKYFYLYNTKEKSWRLINTKSINDANENITSLGELNSLLKLKETQVKSDTKNAKRWNGNYEVNIDYGKLDENSEMAIDFNLEIKDGNCTFSGMGYKTDFTDQCKMVEEDNTLILKYEKNIDGDGFSDHSDFKDLGEIIYKNGEYYLKSPIVADSKWNYNTEIKLTKSK